MYNVGLKAEAFQAELKQRFEEMSVPSRSSAKQEAQIGEIEESWLGDEGTDDDGSLPDIPDNPDELYDPSLDEKYQAWVDRKRGGRRSDAILSCPGCLTAVCLDCQAHATYDGQFRAMFCMNVRVDKSSTVPSKIPGHRKGKRRRNDQAQDRCEDESQLDEVFYPVTCSLCEAQLGVQDKDQVFHLYHVVASNP